MEKLEKFSFTKEDGTVVNANIVGCFTVKEIGKTFLLYNTGEDDSVDVSLVINKGNVIELDDVSDEDLNAVEKLVSLVTNEEEV